MTYRNEVLYKAIKEYVLVATDLVARRLLAQSPADVQRESSALGAAFFHARLSSGDELAALPEYQHCLEVLRADSNITKQLDVMVGTITRKSRSSTAEQLMNDLLDLGVCYGAYQFDSERFEREYAIFEEAFYGDDILYDVIVPLENLLVEGSVRLSDDLEISPLTDDDIDPYGTSKSKLADRYEGLRGQPCAIRSKFRARKVVRRDDEQPAGEEGSTERTEYYAKQLQEDKDNRARQSRLNERIEEVVNSLRLFGVESVFHVVIIYRALKWFGHDSSFPNPVRGDTRLIYEQDEEWLHMFGQLWQGVQSEAVQQRKFIGLALRRLGYAHERHRVEDRIIDLLIAAEALFLSDTGSETYRGELQYRLAQRAGFLLGGDSTGRLKVYRHMKHAYKLRSKVVHGGNLKPLKLEDGSSVDMQEFVETTKVYLRFALRKIIELAQQSPSSGNVVEWDELIFAANADSDEASAQDETT